MYSFSRYKEQYRANLKLALPVVLSQVGQILVQFADNAMVGQKAGKVYFSSPAAAFFRSASSSSSSSSPEWG